MGLVMVVAASFTFAYSARMILPVFPGPPMEEPPREGSVGFLLPVAVVSLAGVVLGLAGPIAEPLLTPAAQAVLGEKAETDLALWHGVNPALLMSLAVIALGSVLVAFRHPLERLLGDRKLLPFTAIGITESLRDGSIALGRRVGDVTRSDAPFGHLAWPLVMLVVLAGGGLAIARVDPVHAPITRPTDWILLFLVTVGVVLANVAHTRMTIVVVVGVAGFAMSLFFFTLGAVDVALTQLMIETLTLVVIVLVLARLPDTFHRTGRARLAMAGVLAVLTGAAAGLGTWAFTGRRDLSEVGRTFLTEGEELTGGTNVVNTILVDFRALDTLGEFVVLGVAALAVIVALEGRGLLPYRPSPRRARVAEAVEDPVSNTIILRVTDRFLGPLLLVLSAYLFLRGHNAPGGGFVSALVLGAGISLIYLAAPDDRVSRLSRAYVTLIGWGAIIGVVTGLAGYADGSFLRPLHASLGGIKLTSALVFDLAVYLAVAGIILAAISRLGTTAGRPPLRKVGTQEEAMVGRGGTVDEPHHPDTAPRLATTGERDRTRAPWLEPSLDPPTEKER
ncbi:hydrogen gas-evolving membrane-bound hydrogenase subunit E [Mobilicoccus caccae]|uniref:hydrogen gas-evolving membrane-bound hydrogenase subunit E n=1 Tax=Mobilicoccus caccae TaxID=1859295 RepID=UPI0024E0E019|nr:hydrogen gas-evolving membrane-bound hydrogenase subunit E [Mobilicoccus caccae]